MMMTGRIPEEKENFNTTDYQSVRPAYLSQTIDQTTYTAQYDACVKELLADKQILSRIMKGTLEEFKNFSYNEIAMMISDIRIGTNRTEPGFTNRETIQKESEEDIVLGEGKIYFDIRFSAILPDQEMKVLLNIEAQKSSKPEKLGYHLENRIIYYLSRMISAQKETEFFNSSYDDLKPVRSIWICMDGDNSADSITRIRMESHSLYGELYHTENLDKVQAIIIRLRKNPNAEKSKNKLIAMLEELLRKENAAIKKKKLQEEYGMIMYHETERRVNTMCNLSEVILESGIEQGIEKGIEQGIEKGIEQGIEQGMKKNQEELIKRMLSNGKTPQEISDFCMIPLEDILSIVQ